MNIITTTPSTLSDSEVGALNRIVARAFEHTDDESQMLDDTKNHLAAAETIQIATHKDVPVALAMYRSCLWRLSY